MATSNGEGLSASAGVSLVSDQEIRARLASVRVGIVLSALVVLGAAAYALATWDEPNRTAILIVIGLGALTVPLIAALPIERIVRSRWCEAFFVGWSGADLLLIAVWAGLDGGSESPYMLLLVLPFLFSSLSYPTRGIVLVGALALTAFFVIGFAVGGGFPLKGFGLFSGLCIALLGSWEARNKLGRRKELEEAASALARSEQSSRLQAHEQQEVARFGQLALEGAGIEELSEEASEILAEVLDVDVAVVMKLQPGGRELLLVAAVGLPEELIGKAAVPAGQRSQSGHVLSTGMATVVPDWERETRFDKSPLQTAAGLRSAATVLIRGKRLPYGVLGAGSREPREFSPEDVNFMQAIANVLANAIERRRSEERTQHDALHDPLTGLPNRNLFLDRLQHALSVAARRDSSIAVLFLDLDQFKLINDSLGHAAGDELLAAVAPRLEQVLRPGDTVARFGGDEFAVLAEDIGNEWAATGIAERIAEALTRPFILRDREHFVSASIGISIGDGSETPDGLIRDADSALYRAKEHGRGGYEIFDEVMRSRVIEHVQTENDLRRAIQRQELELHFQPVVRLRDGAVVSMEALLRWNHPERGLVGPLAFIPVAEESGLIVPIGRWVIEQACRQVARWQQLQPDRAPVAVAVNLSARQIADPDLVPHIEGSLKANKIDPSTLWLELTETILFDETAVVERTIESLQGLGVRLVLDDFGVGFSSLGYLRRLPLSMIKLDRSFVENIAASANDAAIVRAVSEMARVMRVGVVAEGIETEDQLRIASGLGCDFAQGYYFSEPVPGAHVERVLSGTMPAVR